MNDGYIPRGMIEKGFRWEYVNYALYYHLNHLNTDVRLQQRIENLVTLQESQLVTIQQMSATRGNLLSNHPNHFDPPYHIPDLLDELIERESELLREYQSYPYFSSSPYFHSIYIKKLIEIKKSQIEQLNELKPCFERRKEPSRQEYYLHEGYDIETVVDGLTFPTVVTFDDQGSMYVAEAGYAYGAEPGEGRILKITPNGKQEVVAGGFSGPVTGLTWFNGEFFVAEGGIADGSFSKGCGQITRLSPNGEQRVIVSGLKSCGDHFTGDIKVGYDQKLYFTVGTATNSGVVGTDNLSWLKRNPRYHDTPARDYVLYGKDFVTKNPLTSKDDVVETGAFKPFGVPTVDGEVIQGSLYANGVVYCCDLDGNNLHVYADGFRNPFGLAFSPFNGKLYVTDNGADNRGSRPINEDWDNFWEVEKNGWYGWPDFFSGLPANHPHFHVKGKPKPTFLIKNHPKLARQPIVRFEPHTSSDKFSFSINEKFGYVGDVFIGQLGAMDGKSGLKVVRLNMETGQVRDFYANKKGLDLKTGPKRPVAAIFNPSGEDLFVVDFGLMGPREKSAGTGSVWKISRG